MESSSLPPASVGSRPERAQERAALTVKKAVDVVGATVGLLVLLPALMLVALLVKLDSRGRALFVHRRLGLEGRPFGLIKFRTMVHDAEELLEASPELSRLYRANGFKIPSRQDPRLTRVGRLLRRWSLDELPQLVNVLRGEMSLVGPRPIVPEELAHYRGREALFLSVKPGITGRWAVLGRTGIGYPERCEVELEYIRSWSNRDDWALLLSTIGTVLRPPAD